MTLARLSALYPSDMTHAEWTVLEPLLPNKCSGRTGRPRLWSLRSVVDGIFYVLKSGCTWRMLPREYPPWQTVYDYFRRWRRDGTWEAVHGALRERLRTALGRDPTPSGAVMDSQSVKTAEKGGTAVTTGSRRSRGASATC